MHNIGPRYSLVTHESTKEDEVAAPFDIDVATYASVLKPQASSEINSAGDMCIYNATSSLVRFENKNIFL
jgi:hypothetical protein